MEHYLRVADYTILHLSLVLFTVFSLCSADSAIVNGVYWSEALNRVFVDNFERDPSLTWQYFGSAKGFFRQYPGNFMFMCFLLSLSVWMRAHLSKRALK